MASLTGLTAPSHAHIYGIDLASSSELIAHQRSTERIAYQIGADSVIYQKLSDLIAACASLSPRDPETQSFEVGVFCGKYVTAVSDDYFEHLERIRGESQRMKVMERARQAVIDGIAGENDLRMAANGVAVDRDGKLLVAGDESARKGSNGVCGVGKLLNGTSMFSTSSAPPPEGHFDDYRDRSDESTNVKTSQDISLHNFNDHPL